MANKKKEDGLDYFARILERVARLTGTRFQKIEKADGDLEFGFTFPAKKEYLSVLMASLPAAIIEELLEPVIHEMNGTAKKPKMPPNDTFEGKKRF